MSEECLKLTVYFGERDRVGRRFLADVLAEIYARRGLATSVVMRGTEGFGAMHSLRTDRLLTLSEDLPMVSVAVDAEPKIRLVLEEVQQLRFNGLVTLERARMTQPRQLPPADREPRPQGLPDTKLTLYLGRHEGAGRRPAYEVIVDRLRAHGIAGATVLLGVDGTAHGKRRRARFFAANTLVPLMLIAVGDSRAIEAIVAELRAVVARPVLTLERVAVLKRDGQLLAHPPHLPEADASGLGIWQKLSVYAGEQASHEGQALHPELVRRLRAAGAAGATSLRAIWGYHGGDPPRGDSFWQLRRRVPVLTVTVDAPERVRRWFEVVDELTTSTGLVTSEVVPAFRASASEQIKGGLRLARPMS